MTPFVRSIRAVSLPCFKALVPHTTASPAMASETLKEICAADFSDALEYALREPTLRSKLDLNAEDAEGEAPLHHAACRGSLRCTILLLQSGANPYQKNKLGYCALDFALFANHKQVARVLGHARKLVACSS
jgi:ankyrin repeat protein